jgi:hypothetical protein
LGKALVKLGAVHAIEMEEEVIFMSLNIDGESIKSIHQSFVSKFLLPLCPLIIKDIIKRRDSISLLPFI